MTRRTCTCPSCRARADSAFWRIIHANDPTGTWWETLETATLAAHAVARVGRYGFPPVPVWDGEPAEYGDA